MAKIEINKVAELLRKYEVEPAVMRRILEDINNIAQPEADEQKVPALKKQHLILISDPEDKLDAEDLVGWVLQLPEDASPLSVHERIQKAAYDFNASRRGRLLPVKTIGEAMENVPAKHFKDVEAWVKTKTPVMVLKTDNKLPTE